MARRTGIVITLALLAALLLLGQAAGAAIPADFQVPIDGSLAWLARQQDRDTGSFGEFMRVQQTSFAVKKMLDRAREQGKDPFEADPGDPDYYQYHPQLVKGLDFILGNIQKGNPADPTDPVNGDIGSIWDAKPYILGPDPDPPSIVIETSAAILALTGTGTPDATWTGPDGATVTYRQVVQDAVHYLRLAQMSGPGEDGGWPPVYQDQWLMPPCVRPAGEQKCLDTPLRSSQKSTGIATLALSSAEREFDIPMGDDVRAGLSRWVSGKIQNTDPSSMDFGGAYAWIPDPENPDDLPLTSVLLTGYLLSEQKEAAPPLDHPRVDAAAAYLENRWDTDLLFNDYEALYSVMRGLDAWEIREIGGGRWFDPLAQEILLKKGTALFWTDGFGEHPDGILPTEYALLVLEGWDTGARMGMDATATPQEAGSGQEVLGTVTITNTGESSIFGLTLTEVPGTFSLPAEPQAGDDLDGILEPGETWTYTGSTPVYATVTTTFTASGEDLRGQPVTASDEVTVTVTTSKENNPPVATGQSVTTNQGIPVEVTLQATDPESDPLVFSVVSLPGHGTLDTVITSAETPLVVYTPDPGYFGPDGFTFQASDGSALSNIATVAITVNEVKVNVAPVAESQAVSTNENTPRDITLTATDQNDDPLTYEVLSAPTHGTLTGTAPALTYRPALNWYGGDSFTFRASDGELTSDIGTVSITVVHENQPPVVDPAGTTCLWPPDHKFAVVPVPGVTDPDGDSLSITITSIMSDEPMATVTGAGGKNHVPDATGVGTGIATLLRAERSGNNNGRVYTISFTADDGNGGTAGGIFTACVPHDQSQNCICRNDGANYDATV